MATLEEQISARLIRQKAMNRSLVVRVSDELHDKLKGLAERTQAATGTRVTVSDIARAIMEEGAERWSLPISTALNFPNFDADEARRMLEAGHSVPDVAKHFRMSTSTLKKLRRAAGF
jgi:hypothetical protein